MARSPTTSDVFNAIAEVRRREILDALMAGEKAVGTIVADLSLSQPQVSKHLRVLSEVGLVKCRAQGRHRLYSLEPARLRPREEARACEQMRGSPAGRDEGVLDRPARRRELPLLLRHGGRNRVLVP